MSDEESLFNTQQELREIYYDPVRGYQSASKLWKEAKESGLDVSLSQVKGWLEQQESHV